MKGGDVVLSDINIRDLIIEKDYLKKIVKNIEYNEIIGNYYSRLYYESNDEKFGNKRFNLLDCNSIWVLDKYEKSKIKDFQKTNLCKDKFCNNCKKVKQASRMSKFIPLIRPYAKNMYQLTLTVPNVSGKELNGTIKRLFSSFARLIEFLKGKKKIANVDFLHLEYEGAIRSLEVTFKNNSYHPHLHALLVLNGSMSLKTHENVFSTDFKGNREKRLFTDEEILIQKIWRLLYDGELEKEKNKLKRAPKITYEKIEKLERGYSCTLDKSQESDFVEIFKYMTKATDEDDQVLTYQQFKILYFALLNKRQIQGYGCFFGLKDDDEISAEEVDEIYNEILEELRKKESPETILQSPQDLKKDKEYTLISRKRVYQHLKNID